MTSLATESVIERLRLDVQQVPQVRQVTPIIEGRGTLYTWNLVSPRFGVTTKLSADGRTMLRASYGRYSQGVLTGELDGHQVTLALDRIDPKNFPQRSTPFHWVQNSPHL